jgi:hypothetical protein
LLVLKPPESGDFISKTFTISVCFSRDAYTGCKGEHIKNPKDQKMVKV